MFKIFNDDTPKELEKDAENIYKVSTPRTSPQTEFFRVGATTNGMTTLTLMSSDGYSSTLSLNRNACEQLIRMLRATYEDDSDDESTNS